MFSKRGKRGGRRALAITLSMIVFSALFAGGGVLPASAAGSIQYRGFMGAASDLTVFGTSVTLTTTTAAAEGDSIILSFGMDGLAGAVTASDTAGNVYSVDADVMNADHVRSVILSAHNVTALPAGSTITVSHPAIYGRAFTANTFSGLAPSGTRDRSAAAGGHSTLPSSGAMATTQPDELVIGSLAVEGNAVFSAGGGFTSTPSVAAAGSGSLSTIYRIVSSTGSYSAGGTLSANSFWTAAAATYVMDVEAPAVAITDPVDDSFGNDNTPTISGTAGSANSDDPDVKVTIYRGQSNSDVVYNLTATVAADGTWSVTVPSALADGNYTAVAQQSDSAGNVTVTNPVLFRVDVDIPAAPAVTGPSPDPGSSTSVQWSFTGEPQATFRCELSKGATVISSFATCSSPMSYNLANGEGVYTFTVRQFDRSNNRSPDATEKYTLDTTPPQTTIDVAPNFSASSDVTFEFSANESATFSCRLDGGAYSPCTSPKTYSPVGDGPHVFSVYATDAAGNDDTSPDTAFFAVDTTAPTSSASSPNNSISADFNVTYSSADAVSGVDAVELWVKGPDDSAFWLYGTDGTPGSPTFAFSGTQGSGTYEFYTRAIDFVGNREAAKSVGDTATVVNLKGPDVTIDSGPTDPTSDPSIDFTFSSAPNATFECSLSDSSVDAFAPCSSPASYPAPVDGTYTFKVRATDPAGRVGDPAAWAFTYVTPVTTTTTTTSTTLPPTTTTVPDPTTTTVPDTTTTTVADTTTTTVADTTTTTVADTTTTSTTTTSTTTSTSTTTTSTTTTTIPDTTTTTSTTAATTTTLPPTTTTRPDNGPVVTEVTPSPSPTETEKEKKRDPIPAPPTTTPKGPRGPAPTFAGEPQEAPGLRQLAAVALQTFAFPLLLAILVLAYLLLQYWIDRKDPKLAVAPVHSNHDLAYFG